MYFFLNLIRGVSDSYLQPVLFALTRINCRPNAQSDRVAFCPCRLMRRLKGDIQIDFN